MGNWIVVIEGIGTHDTPGNTGSIEEQVAEFVKALKATNQQKVTEVLVASGQGFHRATDGAVGPSAQGRFCPAGDGWPNAIGPVIGNWNRQEKPPEG